MKKIILDAIEDVVTKFLYYDRKDDEELPVGVIHDSITNEDVSIEDIVNKFESELRKGLLD
jgi:hypothetical protein